MSDTLNALSQAGMLSGQQAGQSNLLSMLSTAHVANPAAALQAGTQAASSVYDLRQKQANQAIGSILQQATDENGNVDYGKAQSLAAQAGPIVAAGMQDMLKNNAALRGSQIQQAGQLYNMLGEGAGSILNDPSDQNIASIRARFQNLGMPAGALAELDRIQSIPDLNQRKTEAFNHLRTIMGAQYNLAVGGYPVPAQTQMPQGLVTTTTAPPSPYAPTSTTQAGGVASTMSPGEVAALPSFQYTDASGKATVVPGADVVKLYGYGALLPPGAQGHVDLPPGWKQVSGGGGAGAGGGNAVNSDGTVASPNNPPRTRQLNVPGQSGGGGGGPARAAPVSGPPAPPGAPAGAASSPYTGGGIGAVLNPGGAPAPAPVAPAPRSDLGGGVPVASTNALAPNVGPASPPSAAVPGDVNAILAGMNRTRGTPVTGPQTAAAYTFGPSAEEVQGYKTSADKLAADDAFAAEWQKTQFPYVQALKNYGEGTKTGPGTDFWNQIAGSIRTPLAKLGVNIGPLADTTERVDSLGKWLANILPNARSDADLAQVLKGSATTHINEVAGEDMVKAGFALSRMRIALDQDWHNNPALQAQYGTYLRYLGDMNNKIDPRAFMVDLLNDKGDNNQKSRLISQIKNGTEADAARFEASLALARRTGQIAGAGSAAMP